MAEYSSSSVSGGPTPSLEVCCHHSRKVWKGPDNIVQKASKDEAISHYERVIETPDFLPIHFLEEGFLCSKAVCRVDMRQGLGTGFLIAPGIVMTNNHVLPSREEARDAVLQFNYQDNYDGFAQAVDYWELDTSRLFFTDVDYDFTIVSVKRQGNRLPGDIYGFIQLPQSRLRLTTKPFPMLLNIIQHPEGRKKEVALHNNRLEPFSEEEEGRTTSKKFSSRRTDDDFVDVRDTYRHLMRYTTDTEPGSSGSPVFNNAWELIALHHASGKRANETGRWINNEGILADAIVEKLRARFGTAGQSGLRLLQELGIAASSLWMGGGVSGGGGGGGEAGFGRFGGGRARGFEQQQLLAEQEKFEKIDKSLWAEFDKKFLELKRIQAAREGASVESYRPSDCIVCKLAVDAAVAVCPSPLTRGPEERTAATEPMANLIAKALATYGRRRIPSTQIKEALDGLSNWSYASALVCKQLGFCIH